MIEVTKALSMSPLAQQWLKHSQFATVLHIFKPASNLVNAEGQILSMVNPRIGNGPFSVVLDIPDFTELLEVDSKIIVDAFSIFVGSLVIDVSDAQVWKPQPDWEQVRAHQQTISSYAGTIHEALLQEAPKDSIALFVIGQAEQSQMNKLLQRKSLLGVEAITGALQSLDATELGEAARILAGLGPGLTPAGDDFLIGIMHALWALLPEENASLISKQIANIAVPRTASISANWLEAAARGEAGETWHALFDAMLAREQEQVEAAILRILPTGHTSGADALAGFIHTLEVFDI
ncbi:MAG: DUF2877 domain-containing protein [Chloroflexi bacterium]|nr:MAG: DUF2877 domain-containing protein [Chloroflexota bacterium]MBL1196103.1 DUF2877 domain-containing protein [Chloroflexota bacterium]NOH13396.1 DUF2877 domain-containing protein [Chloroflexota bacterium]